MTANPTRTPGALALDFLSAPPLDPTGRRAKACSDLRVLLARSQKLESIAETILRLDAHGEISSEAMLTLQDWCRAALAATEGGGK